MGCLLSSLPHLCAHADVPQLLQPPYLCAHAVVSQLLQPPYLCAHADVPQLLQPPYLCAHADVPQLLQPPYLCAHADVPQLLQPPYLCAHADVPQLRIHQLVLEHGVGEADGGDVVEHGAQEEVLVGDGDCLATVGRADVHPEYTCGSHVQGGGGAQTVTGREVWLCGTHGQQALTQLPMQPHVGGGSSRCLYTKAGSRNTAAR